MRGDAVDIARRLGEVMGLEPQARALQFKGEWSTWADLAAVGGALDAALLDAGLGEGAGVGIVLRNRPPIVGAIVGTLTTRRCVLCLSPLLPDDALADDVRALRPAVIVADVEDWARAPLAAAAKEVGALGLSLTGDPARPVEVVAGLEEVRGTGHASPEPGTAVSMLTSGTTGVPKRVPLRYADFSEAMLGAQEHYAGNRDDAGPRLQKGVAIISLPLVHISGMYGVTMCVIEGRQLALMERFDILAWAELVREHKPIFTGMPPTGLRMLLDAKVPKEHLASLRAFKVSTAPLDPALAEEFQAVYGIPVLQGYGATEFTGEVAGWTIQDYMAHAKDKRGSVGRAHRDVELRVVDPDGDEDVPAGEQGVLLVRSPHSAGMAAGEWVRTNDLARLDADGFLFIDGRADDVIIRGGFKVHAAEVAEVLEQHPAIKEAAVVGLDDERLGQVPAAAIVLAEGVAPSDAPGVEELAAFVKERLAPYKVPVVVKVVDELPRNHTLKVIRPALRELLASHA